MTTTTTRSPYGIVSYATYLPRHRVMRDELGTALGVRAGRGARVAASFDEDSTTMGVEAARRLRPAPPAPASLYFATTSPAYLDKTNACALHAALGLPRDTFAADLAGSARSGIAALRAAGLGGGLAVLSDVRTGRPGSADERDGGDGAAAFLFGAADAAVAEILAHTSATAEFLDRWRTPGSPSGEQWEERFGLERYLPLIEDTGQRALKAAGTGQPDHVLLVSPNAAVRKRAPKVFPARLSASGSPLGHSGAADAGLALADVLDRAGADETILLLSAADGCDALLLRTTDRLPSARQHDSLARQLAEGLPVPYPTYLTWRGWLEREPPRRPEPDRPAGPPSARGEGWKFGFTGSRCESCGFVHLPPARVCKDCGAVDVMAAVPLAGTTGTVATYTVDRLAHSPSPPLIDAVVDFDGGGRCTLEIADTVADELDVGVRVEPVFRRLHTAGGVHNYFWKARTTTRTTAGTKAGTTASAAADTSEREGTA
ncbi:OB-fold domain-containing protein [Streptomyces sp. NPDC005760]|uniref:OB-fold domain-containing protein n=1 Tax=Streptomyces sp. NPDC005760 TaxID=3156718 RepID=UPI003406EA3B